MHVYDHVITVIASCIVGCNHFAYDIYCTSLMEIVSDLQTLLHSVFILDGI